MTSSPTVALIEYGFPSFARGLIGRVEIAHEAAAPLEFALALTLNATSVEWSGENPKDCLAFSGWVRVEKTLQLHDVGLALPDLTSSTLHVLLAIRSPEGAGPLPAGSFWREFALVWDV